MPAPAWQSASAGSLGATLSLVITKPAGTVDGDLLVAFVANNTAATITAPAGWTLIVSQARATNSLQAAWWRIASGEPADYTFTQTVSGSLSGSIHRISGHHATPVDVSAAAASTAQDTAPTAPTVTTTAADTLLVYSASAEAAAQASITAPAGMTERAEVLAGAGRNHHVATQTLGAAGATGTRAATLATAAHWVALNVAVAPAAAAPPPSTTHPAITVEVAFATTPFTTPSWTDVTAFVVGGDVTRGRTSELDRIRAGQATVVLVNDDRRFDPTHTAGPYWPNVLPMRRLRIRAVFDAVTYDVFTGFIDRWEQTYQHPGVAHATVTATDAFKVFAANDLPGSAYAAEVLADGPAAWWRLDEPQGSTTAYDYVGTRHLTTVGTPTFQGEGLITRESNTAVTFDANTDGLQGDAFLAGAPFTLEVVYRWISGAGSAVAGQTTGPGGRGYNIEFNQDGRVYFYVFLSGAVQAVSTTTTTINDGNPHHVVVVWQADGALKIYVDGADRTGTPATQPAAAFGAGGAFIVNAGQFGGEPVTGNVSTWDELAVYDAALPTARIAAHADARATPWDGETSGTRVGRILDTIDWPASDRDVDAGQSTLQAASPTGSVLAYLQKVEESEGGLLYVAKDGKVRFRSRHAGLNVPSQGTFGDGDPATELEYVDIAFDYSESLIYNEIRVSRADGVVQVAEDVTSQTAYGERTYTADGLLVVSDGETLDRAHFLLGRYKDPVFRTTRMVVQPSGDTAPALFPQVLGREIGDKLTVRRKPQNVGATIDQAVIVEGMRHSFRTRWWSTEFSLSPTAATGVTGNYWQAGVAGASEAGTTTRAAY